MNQWAMLRLRVQMLATQPELRVVGSLEDVVDVGEARDREDGPKYLLLHDTHPGLTSVR